MLMIAHAPYSISLKFEFMIQSACALVCDCRAAAAEGAARVGTGWVGARVVEGSALENRGQRPSDYLVRGWAEILSLSLLDLGAIHSLSRQLLGGG